MLPICHLNGEKPATDPLVCVAVHDELLLHHQAGPTVHVAPTQY